MDQFDVPLQDDDLMTEVELTASLIVAANETAGQLSASEIDRILGVVPEQSTPSSAPAAQP